MITVKQALKLSEFRLVKLVAGRDGTARHIRWPLIMDTDDIGEFLEGDELLVTSGKVWPRDSRSEAVLLQSLIEHQIAGIIFATGKYLDAPPETVIRWANEHSIPILETSYRNPFIALTRAVGKFTSKWQIVMENLLENQEQKCREIVRRSTSLQQLDRFLSLQMNIRVIITDTRNLVIYAGHEFQTLRGIQYSVDKLQIDFGMTEVAERKVTNGLETLGKVYFVSRQMRQFPAGLDELIAMFVFEQLTIREEETLHNRTRHQEFLRSVISGENLSHNYIRARCLSFGLSGSGRYAVLVFSHMQNDRSLREIQNQVQKWIELHSIAKGFAQIHRGRVICILALDAEQNTFDQQINALDATLKRVVAGDRFMIFRADLVGDLSKLQEKIRQSVLLSALRPFTSFHDNIVEVQAYPREWLLYENMSPQSAKQLRYDILGKLQPSEDGDKLYTTLVTLIRHDFNRSTAGREMGIHRNTLTYRLGKLTNLLDMDLESFANRFWLKIAIEVEAVLIYSDSEPSQRDDSLGISE